MVAQILPHLYRFLEKHKHEKGTIMTIESYLRGLVGFDITDEALESILFDRNIIANTDAATLTRKHKDLLYADTLMWAATKPSSYTGTKESDGGWSYTAGSSTLLKSDKERFEEIANSIYDRYDDERKAQTDIRIINLNGFFR